MTGKGCDAEDDEQTFLLDVMLGKLATYLRMCGYDAAYALDRGIEADDRIRDLALAENRTLLTRDEQLAQRTPGALLLTERDVTDQLRALAAEGLDLSLAESPTRCGNCNGRLDRVEGTESPDTAAERPEHAPDDADCYRCRDCGQWFWTGSHLTDVEETLASL